VQKGRLQPWRSQALKRLITTILTAFLGLYLLSLSVFVPYFNWTHDRDHGLLQWVLFGEVVASAKAVLWPYFVFGRPGVKDATDFNPTDRESNWHYTNSKKACDEALLIIVKRGDVAELTRDEANEVVRLRRLAISKGQFVEPGYLQRVHHELPRKYREEYLKAFQMLAEGLESNNRAFTLAGTYGYNEFAEWMKDNRKGLKFP
jgi:hypothetical protein